MFDKLYYSKPGVWSAPELEVQLEEFWKNQETDPIEGELKPKPTEEELYGKDSSDGDTHCPVDTIETNDKQLDQIYASETPVVRFVRGDKKLLEHTMTELEQKALKTIYELYRIHSEI